MEQQTLIEETIDKRIVLSCSGKNGLIIGDPDYLENIHKCEKRGLDNLTPSELHNYNAIKDLVYKGDVAGAQTGIIAINHINQKWKYDYYWGKGTINCGYYHIKMSFGRSEDIARVVALPSNLPFEENNIHSLGCDCAQFNMYCDENVLEYKTGSDGLYGYWGKLEDKEYPINNIFMASVNIDDSMMSLKEIQQHFTYLFNAKETTLMMDEKNPEFFTMFKNQEKIFLKTKIAGLKDMSNLDKIKGSDLFIAAKKADKGGAAK